MVGDPPAFWYHTRRHAAVIPNEDIKTLLEAAERYEMRYVLLEANHPAPLDGLHARHEGHPRLRVAKVWRKDDAVLYAIQSVD